jgi:hypothetical protein
MSAFLFNTARGYFLGGGIAWGTDTIDTVLVTSAYAPASSSTDANLSDVASGHRVGSNTTLTTATFASGIADADDTTLTAVTTGSTATAIIIFKSTGTESTSHLVCYIDTYTGLPVLTNGGNITIAWPTSGNKIFKL